MKSVRLFLIGPIPFVLAKNDIANLSVKSIPPFFKGGFKSYDLFKGLSIYK